MYIHINTLVNIPPAQFTAKQILGLENQVQKQNFIQTLKKKHLSNQKSDDVFLKLHFDNLTGQKKPPTKV